MVDPNNSIVLEWKHVNYSVTKKSFNYRKFRSTSEQLNVLTDVSGHVESGQLVAIIGPSGAGKTTLLAAISHRIRGNVTGKFTINGYQVGRQQMVRQSSFVPQFDITADALTAREHLYFMCELRMDRNLPRTERLHRINEILWQLGLQKVANVRISLMSGGERKKLNLATELLTDPEIVFCDEPTTGLDSYSAFSVIKSLKELTQKTQLNNAGTLAVKRQLSTSANLVDSLEMEIVTNGSNSPLVDKFTNKAIICSIHQPTSDVFECFTHIIIVSGGRIAFQGTVDEASALFSSLGYICPSAYNPAEFYVKLVSDETVMAAIKPAERKDSTTRTSVYGRQMSYTKDVNRVRWLYQVFIIIRRACIESKRSYREQIYKLITFILTGVAIGVMYAAVTDNRQRSIQDINGFIFMLVAQVIFATAYNVVYFYPSMLPILRRETGETIYDLSAYYIAIFLCSIPRSLMECFFFLTIVYPWIGFTDGFIMFLKIGITLTITAIPATAYGLMLSGMFESSVLTTEMAPPFDVLLCIMAGFYIKLDRLWFVKYLTPFHYSNEAISILIWKEIHSLDCTDTIDSICFSDGDQVLQSLSYGTMYERIFWDYGGLLATAAVMNVIGFVGVRRMVNRVGYY